LEDGNLLSAEYTDPDGTLVLPLIRPSSQETEGNFDPGKSVVTVISSAAKTEAPTPSHMVCPTCGSIAVRQARFCQEGHTLVQQCLHCHGEFAVDHQRCDFCGKLPSDDLVLECPLCGQMGIVNNQRCNFCGWLLSEGNRQSKILQGRVTRIVDFGAFVEIFPGIDGLLHISEIADQRVRDVRKNHRARGE
jgi:RecJ-like exonuclease